MDNTVNMETAKVKNYVKELLKSRIFLGRYVERRLINPLIGYRDIVLVSAAEVELKKDLLELRSACPAVLWIGICNGDVVGQTASSLCLCTEIDNQPFGPFWFQIKSIKFRPKEIFITLKCLRYISDAFLELEPILCRSPKKIKENSDNKLENSVASLNETYNDVVENIKGVLSINNMKEFITFLFAFVIAIFTGSTSFVNFLGNFVLALVREMSILIKNSTPMFLGLLDFFSKIVGGFYILLAMLFKQNTPTTSNKRSVAHYERHRYNNKYDYNQID